MKTVYTSIFQDDAVVLLSILRSCGIEGELLADGMLDSNPLFVTDIKGASIVVPDQYESEALAIAADYRKNKKTPIS